jgi:UDP-glucose 4-epimerase
MAKSKLKILITGGNGFVGKALVNQLKMDNEVVVLDRNKGNEDGIKYLNYNYCEITQEQLQGVDQLIHLAWTSVPATNLSYEQELSENVQPLIRLFKLAYEARVKQIIYFSSAGAVYGNVKVPFVEDGPTKPISTHGKAKLEVEKFLKGNSNSTNWIIVRPTNIIGIEQKAKRGQGLIPTILQSIRSNKELVINGNAKKDYLAIDDLVKAVSLLILNPNVKGIFNIGSGQVFSTLEIVALVEKELNKKINYRLLPLRENDVERVEVDTSKIVNYLNWSPQVRIKQLIQQIIISYIK